MEIKLLGKKLEEYSQTDYCESEIMRRQFNAEFALHNIRAVKNRLADRFENECYDHFLMEGNALKTSNQIIAMVRVSLALSLLTDEQWERAIPIIERGLNANLPTLKCLMKCRLSLSVIVRSGKICVCATLSAGELVWNYGRDASASIGATPNRNLIICKQWLSRYP